jgi:hypothetical protein
MQNGFKTGRPRARHEGVRGSKGKAPFIHSFISSRHYLGWVIRFTIQPLYPWEKSRRYQMNRRLSRDQSRSGRIGGEVGFVAEHWFGSSPSLTILQHEEEKHIFFFVCVCVCVCVQFLTPLPSRISPMSLQSWQLWNSLQEPDIWKFRLVFPFRIDQFMSLTSEPSHAWLFGYTLCGRFATAEKLIKM